MPVALTVPFDAVRQPLEGVRVGSVVDPLDEAPEVADQIATEAGAAAVVALGEGQGLADEMRQAPLAAGVIAVGAIAIGDQPTQKGVADQRGEFFLAAATDAVNDRGRRHRHPHPQQSAPLIPGGLVEMDDLGRSHVLDEAFDHLAGDQPVEQHANGGEVLLDRRLLKILGHRLDIGGDMQRLDIGDLADLVLVAPGEEPAAGPVIGLVGSKLRFWPSWGTHNEQAASPRSFRTADFSDNRGEALRIRHIGVDGVR